MEFKKIYLTVSVIALTCSQYAVASPLDNISHTHTQHTLELKPISNSFQIAATVFLPDKGEDLGFNGRELNDNHGNTPQIDLCSKFPLSACPANAKCSKCTSGNKFKLSGCNEGFKLSAGTCVAKSCAEINSAYRADVPVNQVCSTISASGKTCYQTCKAIDFSGYPITSCPANATCADHPDCATTATKKGNCSPIKKKVTTCTLPSQKLNANASGCINKDDTCPSTYFKTCETGTTGTARYTELGTACYQCKPKARTGEIGDILYSDLTTSPDIISGKTPIGVVFDKDRKLAVGLYFDMLPWANEDFNIPNLTNYEKESDAVQDYKGKENTAIITEFCINNSKKCSAAEYVNSYTSFATKAGDWYAPAAGELSNLYKSRDIINTSLVLIGGESLIPYHGSSIITSSTEYQNKFHNYMMWHIDAESKILEGIVSGAKSYNMSHIRPIINYQNINKITKASSPLPILYSDLTTSTEVNYQKTPIGIVFNEEKKLALGLKSRYLELATTNFDVPDLKNYAGSPINDFDGKNNTNKIALYCKDNSINCPGIEFVNNYATPGTEHGDWYLPAAGEAYYIYENINNINKSISLAGGMQIRFIASTAINTGEDYTAFQDIFTSTEHVNINQYVAGQTNGRSVLGVTSKASTVDIRPIIKYAK